MFKNYFKIAIRNLWNKRVYTGINMLGLSVACAFCLLVYLYARQERSFDEFHKNASRLYRLELNSLFDFKKDTTKKGFFSFLTGSDVTTRNMLVQPLVLGSDLKNSLPEIESVVRSQGSCNTVVRYNGESFKMGEGKVAFIENNFFSVFDFPLTKGNPSTVLQNAGNCVINERTAKRLFGKYDPVGKTIAIPAMEKLFTIAGVAKDFPPNSSLDYDIVLPLEAHPSYEENMADRSNNHFSFITLLQLKKNTDASAFAKKLEVFAKKYFAAAAKEWQERSPDKKTVDFHLSIRPFSKAHYNLSTPWGHYTNLENLYQLISLAVIILLIACVNYILLTLTSTISRSQEVGIRKSMGAARKHIIWQFLTETQLLVILSFLAGLVICISSIPLFNSVTGANLDISFFSFTDFAIAAVGLFFLLGVLAGFYPALVMSGMKPLNMLRKFSSVKLNPVLSKSLVIVQYTVCILLIISSLVISKQMKYMNSMQLGFDKEQVLTIENPYEWGDPQRITLAQRIYQYTSAEPAIEKTTFVNSKFGSWSNLNGHIINDKREMIYQVQVDFNYFDFMKIPIIKGRSFLKDMPTDSSAIEIPEKLKVKNSSSVRRAIVVNETLYNLLGKPPLDEINQAMGARIIGVCKDYHFLNSMQKIPPAYHMIGGGKYGFLFAFLRIGAGQNIPGVINRIHSNWNRITAKQPFTFSFLDEEVKKSYESYTQWLKIINTATLLAVLIACMGLFGLSALYAVNRTKEVGIRKVMGATVVNIFVLLNKDVIKLAVVSFVIAIPVAIYFMKSWLQNFAYRIDLSWLFFLLAGCIGLFLAIVAVSYHSIKTSLSNPVKSLRTE